MNDYILTSNQNVRRFKNVSKHIPKSEEIVFSPFIYFPELCKKGTFLPGAAEIKI